MALPLPRLAAVAVALLAAAAVVSWQIAWHSGQSTHAWAPPAPTADGEGFSPGLSSRPQVVEPEAGIEGQPASDEDYADDPAPTGAASPAEDEGPASGAPSDSEIKAELAAFRRALRSGGGEVAVGPRGAVRANGQAVAPARAPEVVKQVIHAANTIAKTPYRWGGGHSGWADTGYDCSGSISFAFAGAGILTRPLNSTGFLEWGEPGPGKWITVYANAGHAFMVIAGMRYDTSAARTAGTRWTSQMRPTAGFQAVHPPGL